MIISVDDYPGRTISVYDVAKLLSDDSMCIIIMNEDDEEIGTVTKKGKYVDYTTTDYAYPDDMHEPLHAMQVKDISTNDRMNIIVHV